MLKRFLHRQQRAHEHLRHDVICSIAEAHISTPSMLNAMLRKTWAFSLDLTNGLDRERCELQNLLQATCYRKRPVHRFPPLCPQPIACLRI